MTPLLYGLGATVVFIAVAFIVGQLRLRKHRGVSREEFVRAFTDADIPAAIPAAVYDYYKGWVMFRDFSVAPDDSYEDILMEGEEDIDDDARFLTKRLGLKMPSDEALVESETRIKTLGDMVTWLNSVSHHQRGHAPES